MPPSAGSKRILGIGGYWILVWRKHSQQQVSNFSKNKLTSKKRDPLGCHNCSAWREWWTHQHQRQQQRISYIPYPMLPLCYFPIRMSANFMATSVNFCLHLVFLEGRLNGFNRKLVKALEKLKFLLVYSHLQVCGIEQTKWNRGYLDCVQKKWNKSWEVKKFKI